MHKSKIVQKFILETEVSKVGNKKFIFMGNIHQDKNLELYTEMIKKQVNSLKHSVSPKRGTRAHQETIVLKKHNGRSSK